MASCPNCGAEIRLTRLGTGFCEPCGLLRLNDLVCDVQGYERGRWIPLETPSADVPAGAGREETTK